jgi:hypothetical protein
VDKILNWASKYGIIKERLNKADYLIQEYHDWFAGFVRQIMGDIVKLEQRKMGNTRFIANTESYAYTALKRIAELEKELKEYHKLKGKDKS